MGGDIRIGVLAYGLWQRRFGGDTNLIGKNIVLDGASRTIVGILAPRRAGHGK
ncbi:MAG: hypothetical protein L0Z50_36980 [Verrucomicrobiales bacterium]|nr:hypothetical protein [Verrucomicrobiales bacterium]